MTAPHPWLTLVGIGEDGLDGLSPAASRAVAQAEILFGGRRHLDLVRAPVDKRRPWPSPLTDAFPEIEARRGRPTVVLASGDPFFHGVGSLIAGFIDPCEILAYPAPSAYALAAARLGWAGQDCVRVTLHGRALERILPHCQPGACLIALSWDGSTPQKLAALLTARGFGRSVLTVLEAMGGPRERVRATLAQDFAFGEVDPLNTIAVEVVADVEARILPLTGGLPDDWFEHDGQISKREVRVLTLSALAPRRGDFLWDVGAGSGSVAIEWMLADPTCHAVAIEENAARAARIARNAAWFGVPDLRILEARAPSGFDSLPPPDAIFIGGGAGDPDVLESCIHRLKAGGRLVVNAVTLETQGDVLAAQGLMGGEVRQLSVSRLEKIGGFHALKPALPIVQWIWEKP
ncbi:precorrin-6y C5,15-methyltransferase (decarboxylating) subunit CbiE [Oryzibacter oryziterrae]|uniref:precorrin-6y C5,15-methyltransferase (decarboxylating) subunit CbiE n=1 Tax=Oryzibacter oryziterrae TaxID=2766474 RepID=UPI001F01EDB6|nr:precorrin-6y C5,15-methyltransferase (decarboxylating) subunit CbiE [Oryzibacter oryziterrae]